MDGKSVLRNNTCQIMTNWDDPQAAMKPDNPVNAIQKHNICDICQEMQKTEKQIVLI